jgi:hypothetical protein
VCDVGAEGGCGVGTTFGGTETGPQEWEQKERASDGIEQQNVTKLLAGWTVRHTGMLKTGDGRSKGKACYIGPDRGVIQGDGPINSG